VCEGAVSSDLILITPTIFNVQVVCVCLCVGGSVSSVCGWASVYICLCVKVRC